MGAFRRLDGVARGARVKGDRQCEFVTESSSWCWALRSRRSGCGAPPTADIDAAKTAIVDAGTAGAADYAAASLKAAEDAQAALDAELKAQEGKWIKSYDKAKELAVAAKTAGDEGSV